MRVLHLGKFFPPFAGGMEHFMSDLLHAQSACGVTVAALVHDHQPGSSGRWPAPDHSLPIYRVPCYGRLLYAPISPAFPFWLRRAIREFKPDLLHLHLPNTSAFWALALPAARRLPWIIHWQSDIVPTRLDRWLGQAYRLYQPLERRVLAASQAVIATSSPYLEASATLAPWRDRCHVIPLGIDPARIPVPDSAAVARAEALWEDKTISSPLAGNISAISPTLAGKGRDEGDKLLRILAIGRLTYYKGHEVLIQAAAALPGAQVLIVGSGDRQPGLQALVNQLDLGGRVVLAGFQPDVDLNALLASCDVLCLPSLDRAEAFGLVLLEAMRFAKPVVVSDIPGSGAGWVTRQAGHGLLVPPGDPVKLAAALRELQADPAQRATLGQAGLAALREHFEIRPIAAAITALYREIVAQ